MTPHACSSQIWRLRQEFSSVQFRVFLECMVSPYLKTDFLLRRWICYFLPSPCSERSRSIISDSTLYLPSDSVTELSYDQMLGFFCCWVLFCFLALQSVLLYIQLLLAWNLLTRLALNVQKSSCICFIDAEIKGLCYHTTFWYLFQLGHQAFLSPV